MKKIKFSHNYTKMSCDTHTSVLLEVFIVDRNDLHDVFVEYDTRIRDGGNYPLPNGKLLVLLLENGAGSLWTTIRRWTIDKEKYYMSSIGDVFIADIQEVNRSLNEYR